MSSWNKPTPEGIIEVPDELDPLINKVGMQIGFLTISGKSTNQTICDIVYICQRFFRENPELLQEGVSNG